MSTSRPTGNRKKQIQKRGRKKLAALLVRQNSKCNWCDKILVKKSDFPEDLIIKQSSNWVIWLKDGVQTKSYWATTDHIIPVCQGGTNLAGNIVAACGPCNQQRGGETNPYKESPRWKNNPVCKCGKSKRVNEHRCNNCVETLNQVRDVCRQFYITRGPGVCPRCNTETIQLKEINDLGMFYKCPTCVKRRRG